MNRIIRCSVSTIFALVVLFSPSANGQYIITGRITVPTKVDSSDLILIGKVFERSLLSPLILGEHDVRIDTGIYEVQVEDVLRGEVDGSVVEILERGDEYPFFLFKGKTYLLYLNPAEAMQWLVEKYSLQGRKFYRPTFLEAAVVNLNEQKGQDELKELREFLALVPPPAPAETRTDVLLEELIGVKHRAFDDGLIGDQNFVSELDNHLENALKHLLRGDEVNCRKEVWTFQWKVDQEYAGTEFRDKKKEPQDRRFVSHRGYILLDYSAAYILDRLPSK